MNKRQKKKALRASPVRELQEAGMRAIRNYGPSPLRPVVGDQLFLDLLKKECLDTLIRIHGGTEGLRVPDSVFEPQLGNPTKVAPRVSQHSMYLIACPSCEKIQWMICYACSTAYCACDVHECPKFTGYIGGHIS